MNKLLVTFIGAVVLGTALPAFAGPDWPLIEQGRKAKLMAQTERLGDVKSDKGAGAMTCLPDALVLPLEHGPRAQTTPYLNEKRKVRFESEQRSCREAARKGSVR